MATLSDILYELYDAPDEALLLIPDGHKVRSLIDDATGRDPWVIFWEEMSKLYETEEELAMDLGIHDAFADNGFQP